MDNPYLPHVLIIALLFMVFFALSLESPTGYVAGGPVALAAATPTPLPDNCGTFEQLAAGIGIKTKKGMDPGVMTGCTSLAGGQYKCPVESYYEKKLCCVNEDCEGTCESSGVYNGFCKPLCAATSVKCKSSAIDSITVELSPVAEAAKYKLEWCILGYAWGSAKCNAVTDASNTITASGLALDTSYSFRARTEEAVPDAVGDMSCKAPSVWSKPAGCTTRLTPLPTATPLPTPVPVPIVNGNFETEPTGTDWNAPDGISRIWDNAEKHGGSRSYKIKSETRSKCYAPGAGTYRISAFSYSTETGQLIHIAAFTDKKCGGEGGTLAGSEKVAENSEPGAWKGVSGTFPLEFDRSFMIILGSGETGKYAWFDDIKLDKLSEFF